MKNGTYLCQLCSFLGFFESVFVHVYKTHVSTPAPCQCSCGFIAVKMTSLHRHQRKSGCSGSQAQSDASVPTDLMMRRLTQRETQQNKSHSTTVLLESADTLDYKDWMMAEDAAKSKSDGSCQTTDSSPQTDVLLQENERLEKEIQELRRVNEAISVEILTPDVGVPMESALSGFEQAWEEQSRSNASSTLFPDPPRRLLSEVTVPDSNRHLSQNERVWKRSSQEAIQSYNKKHKR